MVLGRPEHHAATSRHQIGNFSGNVWFVCFTLVIVYGNSLTV